ncbi:hypothetical protein ACFL6U_20605 [Planctomycetota bacterium]
MDTLKKLERLFERDRLGTTPVFHVSNRVIAELGPRETVTLVPLSVFAGVSAAAAALLLFLAVNAWNTMNGPLAELLTPLQETPLW